MTNPLDSARAGEQPPTGVRICVIGAGYVGLTVAAGLACLGHTVACADAIADKVHRLGAGEMPFLEDGLPELVVHMQHLGRLRFTTDTAAAAASADVVFLCVPTPQGAGGEADLHHVLEVADQIGPSLASGAIVVNKSTVPVGTADLVARRLARVDVDVVANPEFLAEGTALRDFFGPDRIVVGSRSAAAADAVAGLYSALPCDIITTDVRSAELIKYASNAFLATKLSFVNSMAELCGATGADIRAVARGMGADRRIGAAFLRPGPGWGGSCFPKDTQALMRIGTDNGVDLPVVRAAVQVNDAVRRSIIRRILAAIPAADRSPVVAVWGLTFKAGTDDLRDSPALAIADDLRAAGVAVRAYDPTRTEPIAGMTVCADAYEACRGAAVLVVATEWPEFAQMDFALVRASMADHTVIDTRNLLDATLVRACDLDYSAMGTRAEYGQPAPTPRSVAALPH
jgi:UDPglucose 6-dehydrogenase